MRYGLWLLALLLGTALLLLLGHKFNTFCAPPPDAAVKPQTAQERLIDTVPKEQYQRALAKIAKLEGLLTAGAGRSVPDAHRPVARAHPKPVPKEGKEGKEGKDDKPPEKKKHVRRIGLWGRSDNWSLPEIGAIAKPPPSSEFLLQGYDLNGNLVQYRHFPPWRLNRIHGKDYLVYIYVNALSLHVGVNCALTLREYGIQHVLFLCEDREACELLRRFGMYHYYPDDLIRSMQDDPFLRDSYWGPSMWVRTNFNYHLVLAGVHVACIDADVVFTADPIPILFNPKADISMSLHFRRYFPWIWSFPLMEFNLLDGEPTWHAALKRHFVEVNNAVARYDSNARTERFFELLKFRCLVEISQPKKYTGWDQTAIGRVFYEGNVSFDRRNRMEKVGGEKVVVCDDNALNVGILIFQPTTARREDYTLEEEGPRFCCHAMGDVRNKSNAWTIKRTWLGERCCWVLRDGAMDTTEAFEGPEEYYAAFSNNRTCAAQARRLNALAKSEGG